MTTMLIDGIRAITLHANVVRIHCLCVGAEGKHEEAGTLVIPGNEVAGVIQSLVNGLQEMQKQMRERSGVVPEPPPKAN